MDRDLATHLNATCHCVPVPPALDAALSAAEPVFVARADAAAIRAVVGSLEAVAADPTYRTAVLGRAPAIARESPGPRGAFMAFDFHIAQQGPQLIEINTNGGGALVAAGLEPQHALEPEFAQMFRTEWAAQRGDAPLRHIAIVDSAPKQQPMFAEFELFERLFERNGWTASIADPAELVLRDSQLWHGSTLVDLVYNRLTDFYFEDPAHRGLRDAYASGAVVVTPHPHAHALFADKRNLSAARENPVASAQLRAAIPTSLVVDRESSSRLWAQRKAYYFKPAGGHGSRGVYRGAKLTRRTWSAVVDAGDYIAQREIPPPRREILVAGAPHDLKFDVRAYAYAGAVQLLTARVYRGQTTNLRTPGGGFARVIVTP